MPTHAPSAIYSGLFFSPLGVRLIVRVLGEVLCKKGKNVKPRP
ncbi:Hypothetical protein PAU_00811 [Photorhabdus asymbiotica]|uniref:Uncharacterized protein n=1 Tax=Photorhabdus asymbiotica subsp. asymbiotica (strain ATCC 43949 / 3105-77) TaxID=553480 RepID=C7BMR7_PHOAA|nr:Hypothetical protein PAU_00811 [Photorhabdus asymbiotica]